MFRSNGRGTFIIRRRYTGVGEIRRASGTNDRKTFKAILAMLRHFEQTGRHQILREIRDGVASPLEVYGHFVQDNLQEIPTAATLKPISVILEWADQYEVSANTRKRYKELLDAFLKKTDKEAPLQTLPDLLSVYRKDCKGRGVAVTFNRTRTICQAYLRDTFGKDSPLWIEVSRLDPLPVTPKIPKAPASPGKMILVLKKLNEINPNHAIIAQFLSMSGMNWKEFSDGVWEVKPDRIIIEGTKRAARRRIVPLIDPNSIPTDIPKYNTFRMALRKVSDNEMTAHDLRRTYAHWLEMAGIPRSRRKAYLGHSSGTVTDLYEAHSVDRYLKEDAETIRTYLKTYIDKEFEKVIEEDEKKVSRIFKF